MPPSPPILGEQNLTPPKLGGVGGQINGLCVNPGGENLEASKSPF